MPTIKTYSKTEMYFSMIFKVTFLLGVCALVQAKGSHGLMNKASNDFANKLYQQMFNKSGNVLMSPLSLHVGLTLVHQGARGNSATELATALGLTESKEQIKLSYQAVLKHLQDQALHMFTMFYPARSFQLLDKVVSDAKEYFMSEIESLDFNNKEEAARIINESVKDKTNNTITDVVPKEEIDVNTRLMIVNVVYFNLRWKHLFAETQMASFFKTKEDKVLISMMKMTNRFNFKNDQELDAKVLKLKFEMEEYSMIFVLPNQRDGLAAVERKLVNTDLQNLQTGMKNVKVEVSIPKFTVETNINFKNVLQHIGINDIFTENANLMDLGTSSDLYISKLVQRTFIDVNENGTEAAGATVITGSFRNVPDKPKREFRANHPFVFFLIHEKEGLIVFNGRLRNPQAVVIN